jgi:MFS family permease
LNTKVTESEKIRRLPWRFAHNGANTIFVQLTFFGSVYILLLNELGLPKARIGILLSLVPFCGLVSLLIAPAVARAGVKRIFIICWTLRTGVAAGLLLIPWTLARFGAEPTFFYIALLIVGFALCRTVGETGAVSWEMEIIPASMRGKYRGVSTIVETLAAIAAILTASYALGYITDMNRFMVPMGVGVVFGLVSVACASFSPGGAPSQEREAVPHLRQLRAALGDRNFRYHLGNQGLVFLSFGFFAFMPLFMKEQVGLLDDQVVLLQVWSFVGGLLSSYLWGWVTDRYGGKFVILSALFLLALLPICWLLMPRDSEWSYAVAMAISFLGGVASAGWSVSDYRLIYNEIIPQESKTAYTAIYYAWWGFAGGCGPLVAGGALDYFRALDGRFLFFDLDPYTPIFLASPLLVAASMVLLTQLRLDRALIASPKMSS